MTGSAAAHRLGLASLCIAVAVVQLPQAQRARGATASVGSLDLRSDAETPGARRAAASPSYSPTPEPDDAQPPSSSYSRVAAA